MSPVHWTEGARLMTLSSLIGNFKNSSFAARTYSYCENGSIATVKGENVNVLKNGGWKFIRSNEK